MFQFGLFFLVKNIGASYNIGHRLKSQRDGLYFMKKPGQKLFFIASKISGKTKNIIPISLRWKIKERLLRKSMVEYLKKRKIGVVSGVYSQGVNLIGNIKAEMGLGQSCRLLADMILKCGCQLSVYNTDTNNNVKKGDVSFY